jgi:cation:H+ antiporter
MLTDVLLVAAGIALLAVAGGRLVDFAAALGEKARLTPAVVGLTVVAAGTSMPELAVSVAAAVQGSPDIALANVVGSNVANIGFILGACPLLAALPVSWKLLKFEYPFMVLASVIALLLCRDGALDRVEGGFFVASMAAFIAYAVWVARREAAGLAAELVPEAAGQLRARSTGLLLAGIVASLLGLALGARLVVDGAVGIALAAGLSERLVGLTIVAVGTSLPELVASLAAASKRHHDMAVANVVGSNIFNLLMILGASSLFRPIPVQPRIVEVDLPVMIGFAALLYPLVARDRTLTRRDGVLLMAAYAGYLAVLVWLP